MVSERAVMMVVSRVDDRHLTVSALILPALGTPVPGIIPNVGLDFAGRSSALVR